MATLSQLKTQIAGDLHRTDLTSQIASAITAAIQHYERERWWFLEGRGTISTVASQAFYGLPTDLLSYDSLLITISGAKEPLQRMGYVEMDEKDAGNYTGYPSKWAIYADQIRLYPTPNAVYTLTLSYHKKLTALTDNDSNSWTTDGNELIRHRAVWDIYQNYLKAADMAVLAKNSEMDAYKSLVNLNTIKLMTGRMRKTDW